MINNLIFVSKAMYRYLYLKIDIFTDISCRYTLASQSRFDPNWAVAQDLELELKSKLEPKLES